MTLWALFWGKQESLGKVKEEKCRTLLSMGASQSPYRETFMKRKTKRLMYSFCGKYSQSTCYVLAPMLGPTVIKMVALQLFFDGHSHKKSM